MAAVESYSIFSATQSTALSLDSQAFTITAVHQNTPVMRGENVIPAMDHGLRWREKRMGGRQETWDMWVSGEYDSSGAPAGATYSAVTGWSYTEGAREAQFNANWETLMGALTTTKKAAGFDAPLKVMRTMKFTPASPVTVYRMNYGEVNGPIAAEDHGTWSHTRLSVPILYVDPRWYACNSSGVKTTTNMTATGDPGGTALMTEMTITLGDGSTNDPYIENTTSGSKLTFSGNPSGASAR